MIAIISRNARGNTRDRRRRRQWLISEFGIKREDDSIYWVRCHHCNIKMKALGRVWEVDRFPVSGKDGGRYRRGNIVISCQKCNRGNHGSAK